MTTRRRQRPTTAQLLARMPQALRPKLSAQQRRDLSICHHVNFGAIADGQGTPQLLWDWVESVLCWSIAADVLHLGEPEMNAQLTLAVRVVERFGATGAVRFEGVELEAARLGVAVVDELAAAVDQVTAATACITARDLVLRLQQGAPAANFTSLLAAALPQQTEAA